MELEDIQFSILAVGGNIINNCHTLFVVDSQKSLKLPSLTVQQTLLM